MIHTVKAGDFLGVKYLGETYCCKILKVNGNIVKAEISTSAYEREVIEMPISSLFYLSAMGADQRK